MNLDKYIRIKLTELSKKYDISVVEVTKATDGIIGKSYTVNFKEKSDDAINEQMHFYNKRKLVSWLMWLN